MAESNVLKLRAEATNPPAPEGAVYYTDEDLSERLFGDRRHKRRIKDLRASGEGPKYVRVGSVPITRSDWVDEWADAKAVTSPCQERARRLKP